VLHLAAQAGVRYSLKAPLTYADSNLTGQLTVLEGCRHHGVEHLVFASSSSVYGANHKVPFHEDDPVNQPVSLYAATKRAGELMAHGYSHLYGLPATGLRFFTVYGEWGRPDMAYYDFTRRILAGEPITLFNHGAMARDFTYVSDVVAAILRLLDQRPGDPGWPSSGLADHHPPFRLFNIGNRSPVALEDFVAVLEDILEKRAVRRYAPMQPGDVPTTFADTTSLERAAGFTPETSLRVGLRRFVEWYRDHFERTNR